MRLIYSTTDSGDASAGGHQVPFVSFSGPSLEDGKEIAISDFKGKVLLVDFWATWCGPCIAKMPEIVKLYDEYKDEGLEVLGVSLDRADQATAIRRTMARHNMTWPQIYSGEAFEGRPAAANNVRAIPTTFLIDRDGRARYTNLRGEALAKRVQELLAERPGQPISSSDSAADRRSTVQTPSTASEALPLRAPGR
ncbi:MAG: TlpA family protein disulfide reductase [Phycisphaeraceae bacterium]|nr:TlpA family protein disulfide reductase [Phycisphaeraceae bacterium]